MAPVLASPRPESGAPPRPLPAALRRADWSLAISDALTVGDLVRLAPSTLAVLSERGLAPAASEAEETTGTGGTLAELAGRHRVALDALLDTLRDAAAADDARLLPYHA